MHRFRHVSSCTSGHDCATVTELSVLAIAHILPLLLMVVDFLTSTDHIYAFRNSWVELPVLVGYVVVFLVWSVVCSAVNRVRLGRWCLCACSTWLSTRTGLTMYSRS